MRNNSYAQNIFEKITFKYYEEIQILSLTPAFGFFNSDIEVYISAVNVIDNKYLRCRINDFIANVTKVIVNSPDSALYKCIIPHIDDISIDFENKFLTNTISKKSYFFIILKIQLR